MFEETVTIPVLGAILLIALNAATWYWVGSMIMYIRIINSLSNLEDKEGEAPADGKD